MSEQELRELADLARKQRTGRFTTESDTMTALDLIERLCAHLVDKERVEAARRSAGL